MRQTFAEKILSQSSGQTAKSGDFVVCKVSGAMASDTTAPGAITAFKEMGGSKVWDPHKLFFVIDHASPPPNERIANLHQFMRNFCKEAGGQLYDVGSGIAHHVLMDGQHVTAGDLFIGADSHTCTYGAIGAFATGVGATDLAGIMLTGKIWLRVPASLKVRLTGNLPKGSSGKDIALWLAGKLTIAGATYQAIEFVGDAIETLAFADRIPLANMAVEMGAKIGVVINNAIPSHLMPDSGATYEDEITLDLQELEPQVAWPSAPDQVTPLKEVTGQKINIAYLGSCTNNRLEDLHKAAAILKDEKVAQGVRFYISCATHDIQTKAMKDGTLGTLLEAGGVLLPSGCGPCVGTHLGVPADGEVVISSANRNFKGRMGNPNAQIFLGSAETVATAAKLGHLGQSFNIEGQGHA